MPRPDSFGIAVLLTALVAYGPLSTDLYLPSLPTLVTVFGVDIAQVQLTLSVFMAGFAVSQLFYGPLSDRYGRRPVILVGLILFLAASLACALADSIEHLIAARLFQAIGACSGPVLGRAVVRDVYGREQSARIFAYMATAMAIAPAVAPILGGVLTDAFGWRAGFLLLSGFGVVMLVAVALLLVETNLSRDPLALDPPRLIANARRLLGHRAYLGYVLTVAGVFSGIFAFISGSSFVLIDRIGLTPVQYGLCFGGIVIGYMIGSFAAARLTLRLGIDRLILLGTEIAALGGALGLGLALTGEASVAAVEVPMIVFMIGAGLTLPNANAGAVGPFPHMAGFASAVLGFAQMSAAALVGIAVGLLHDGSPLPMMAVIFVAALAGGAAYRGLVGRVPSS